MLQGLPTLRLFGRSHEQVGRLAEVSDRYRRTTLEVLRVAFLSALVLEMVATLSVAVVAVGVGLRLLYGRLPFEEALFVLLLAPELYQPLRRLGASFHAGMEGKAAAERIFEILEEPSPPAPLPGGEGRKRGGEGVVRFEDVTFSYDDVRLPALKNLSFTLEPGKKVALVGASGAGKSTVAHLLLGFARPHEGAVTHGGAAVVESAHRRRELHLSGRRRSPA